MDSDLGQAIVPERDEQQRAVRIAHTERLGNLGWGEWDLLSGHAARPTR